MSFIFVNKYVLNSDDLESCPENGSTKEERQKFLDMHNYYRWQLNYLKKAN